MGRGLTRRQFLVGTGAAATLLVLDGAGSETALRGPRFVAMAYQSRFKPMESSRLGGALDDEVRGSAVLSDGTIVLAANISGETPGDRPPFLLNGATDETRGVLVRLSPNGTSVLSVTRFTQEVADLSLDGDDNLYVAAGNGGTFKLNPGATEILLSWPQPTDRIGVASNGYVAMLDQALSGDGITPTGPGTVTVYDPAGQQVGSFEGHNKTYDVAIDHHTRSIFLIGFKQSTCGGRPVQIAYLQSQSYTGELNWRGYDWHEDRVCEPHVNNMADTRGVRVEMGADGELYAAYMAAGGNHIFRYDPFDLSQPVPIVGGDEYHEMYNSRSEHKTFFARYDPATGAYLLGQQFVARLPDGRANTATLNRGGDIQADQEGRVYLAGVSAWGIPLSLDPLPEQYQGGSWLLVMSPDFKRRLLCTRFSTGGQSYTVAARTMPYGSQIVYGGSTNPGDGFYSLNPIQPEPGGGSDGFLGVIRGTLPEQVGG